MKTNNFKKLICMLLALICVFALCACTDSENKEPKGTDNGGNNSVPATPGTDGSKEGGGLKQQSKKKYATVVATDSENGTITLHFYAMRVMNAGETAPDGTEYSAKGMFVSDLREEGVYKLSDDFNVGMGQILSYDGIGSFDEYDTYTDLSYFMENATSMFGELPLYFVVNVSAEGDTVMHAELCYQFYFEDYDY